MNTARKQPYRIPRDRTMTVPRCPLCGCPLDATLETGIQESTGYYAGIFTLTERSLTHLAQPHELTIPEQQPRKRQSTDGRD